MAKFAWACSLVILPIVLVIGFLSMSWNGGNPAFPSFSVLLGRLSLMPDFSSEINTAVGNANVSILNWQTSYTSVVDWNSFWSCIGNFFNMIGSFFSTLGQILAVPVRFFIWLFQLIGYAYA